MVARIEWRTNGGGDDTLLFVSEYGESENTALKTWKADADRLTDFLNDMTGLDTTFAGLETAVDQRDPEQYGKLILTRSKDGDILGIDPELYWDAIYKWFRAHGKDPHHMRQAPS
jgi:hypothetical protein